MSKTLLLRQPTLVVLKKRLAEVSSDLSPKSFGAEARKLVAQKKQLEQQIASAIKSAATVRNQKRYLAQQKSKQRAEWERARYQTSKMDILEQRAEARHGAADRKYLRNRRYLEKMKKRSVSKR